VLLEQEHTEFAGAGGGVDIAFDGGDDGTLHQDVPLPGKRIGVRHPGLCSEFGEPLTE
jgi:hypothetical protein